ncbi:MAG: VOC family protein [Bacilli bacterium]|nr:VOC family protein [Bacilli bacterium]
MKFNKLIPELSVTDIEVSKKFYLSLGFHIVYERIDDKFAFIELDGNQIMIEEINNNWNVGPLERPFGRGINISMSVNNVEEMFNSLKEKGIKFFLELEVHSYEVDDKVYHDKEFLIQDPDGYLLRFNN